MNLWKQLIFSFYIVVWCELRLNTLYFMSWVWVGMGLLWLMILPRFAKKHKFRSVLQNVPTETCD